MKSLVKRLILLAITALFLYLVLRKVEPAKLWQALTEVYWPLLVPVVLVYLAGFIPRAQKWRIILGRIKPVSLGGCLGYILVGCAANSLLPARLGELVRAFICGRREQVPATSVLSTIVLERVLEVLSLLVLLCAVVWATGRGELYQLALVGLAVCLGLMAGLFFLQQRPGWLLKLAALLPWPGLRERAQGWLTTFVEGLAVVKSPARLAAIIALGWAVYLIEGAAYWLLAYAFDMQVTYLQVLFVLCFIFVGMTIPSTVGNIGPLQYFCVLGLGYFGVDSSTALIYSVFINAMMYLTVPLGLAYMHAYGATLSSLRSQMGAGSGASPPSAE
ncbi:MAG: flippase-like domain-containing protein [Proteobacteria bacterium]|nr:flippase-like domain-containing protein [Pseudomonadota bacterium]MBU4275325.1 flippase-like domain-containing protein [Pseudomonadota bacterium]MBU4382602.1 flippase-like domain-containing protein [Pseudomonadota bacterium]MBU4606118.1 flippase-like domain-containing protein [Pseudomonadota bacterium]MCG2765118.1 flippase-like domain-containing protein [Desulfarculaceae bacterium]